MPGTGVPVVFIHGLWLHSTSWQPWADVFRDAGYDPVIPEWPGVPETVAEARAHPESQAGVGIDEVIEHHAEVVAALPQPPVLVGHSFSARASATPCRRRRPTGSTSSGRSPGPGSRCSSPRWPT